MMLEFASARSAKSQRSVEPSSGRLRRTVLNATWETESLSETQTKLLRWTVGVPRLDRIRNGSIRQAIRTDSRQGARSTLVRYI